jgi:uncharacterized membrane protein (UPF0127 family)
MKMILLADNNLTRAKGLMGHRPLKKDECAYFYFQKEGSPSFWNKNVGFPISLIFLDKEGRVEDIKYLEAHQHSPVVPSSKNVRQVIEAHRDAPEIYKIKIGSRIDFKDGQFIVEGHDDKKSIQSKNS